MRHPTPLGRYSRPIDFPSIPISNRLLLAIPVRTGRVAIQADALESFSAGTALNSGNIVQNLRLTSVAVGVLLSTATGSIVRNNQMTCVQIISGNGIEIEGGGGNLLSGKSRTPPVRNLTYSHAAFRQA
jgi:hypothetical protein